MQSSSPDKSTSPVDPQQLQLESERMQEVVLLVDNLLRQEETTLGLVVDCLYDIGSVRLIQKKLTSPFLQGPTKRVARVSKPLFRILALRWLKKNCPELLAKWLYSKVIFEEEEATQTTPQPEAQSASTQSLSVKEALENPNPVEEISEQMASPPPLPAEVETAIERGQVPAIPPNSTSQALVPVDPPPSSLPPLPEPPPPPLAVPAPPVTLEEYKRAIAQLKFRDTEITKLRTRSRLLTGLLVAVSVALGGALFWPIYGPELGVPFRTEPVQSRQ